MSSDKKLSFLLMDLFQAIIDAEEKTLITGEFQDITINDIHVIEAIGKGNAMTSSSVSKKLGVTMGTLTKSIDGLVRKEYVIRTRSENDKRVVFLSLSPKGKRAFDKHAEFHDNMVKAAIEQFAPEETKLLERTLDKLDKYFTQDNYLERTTV